MVLLLTVFSDEFLLTLDDTVTSSSSAKENRTNCRKGPTAVYNEF